MERPRSEASISTYATRLRGRLDLQNQKQFGQPGYHKPSDEVIEQQYQKELQGGFELYVGRGAQRRKNTCETCFQVLTATGTCGCY